MIVLGRAVVFQFNAVAVKFCFEPVSIEIVHGGAGKIDIDPCTGLTPGAEEHIGIAMRHKRAVALEHKIIAAIAGCFILHIPEITDAPGTVADVNSRRFGCTCFFAGTDADEQQEV